VSWRHVCLFLMYLESPHDCIQCTIMITCYCKYYSTVLAIACCTRITETLTVHYRSLFTTLYS
jgi:hypothetical protein